MGTFNFVNFTVQLWGRITASGSGPGPDTYSITANRQLTVYYIETDKTIIPKGDSQPFYAKEAMLTGPIGPKNSDWTITPAGGGSAITAQGTSWASASDMAAGSYTVSASPTIFAEATSDSKNLKIVEVASVSATSGTTTVTSTTDSPGNDESICTEAQTSGSLTFTATPNPSGQWPSSPEVSYPEWYLGDTKVKNGGSYTFDPTGRNTDVYRVKAKCGTSIKAIDVYIVSCQYQIAVETPGAGAIDITWDGNIPVAFSVGHASWRLNVLPSNAINVVPLKTYTNILRKNVGFHANSSTVILSGEILAPTPTLHIPDSASGKLVVYNISLANLLAGASHTEAFRTSPGDYRLDYLGGSPSAR